MNGVLEPEKESTRCDKKSDLIPCETFNFQPVEAFERVKPLLVSKRDERFEEHTNSGLGIAGRVILYVFITAATVLVGFGVLLSIFPPC